MIKVFNRINVKVSCLGNHDLDLGLIRMEELINQTKPTVWVMANLKEIVNDQTGESQYIKRGIVRYHIIEH